MNELHIAPNRPVYVALVDPSGVFDFDLNRGTYQTTAGQTLVLPRPAVQALNMISPAPGEEIEILQTWDGLRGPGHRPEWSIRLSNRSEKARAEAETAQERPAEPGDTVLDLEDHPAPINAPTPIRRNKPVPQPGLFDERGGTYGPMSAARAYAAPHVVSRKGRPVSEPIPWNVAFREVVAWIAKELRANDLQWSDKAQQAMVCTVLIAEVRKGRIGPWEREK